MKILFALIIGIALSSQSLLAGGACCAEAKSEEKETAKATKSATGAEGAAAAQKQTQAKTDAQKAADAQKTAKAE
jgi:hypothetical protein